MALLIYLNVAPQSAGFADRDMAATKTRPRACNRREKEAENTSETRYAEADALYKRPSPPKGGFKLFSTPRPSDTAMRCRLR